ncbi:MULTISPECIES: shikimate kinase AroK [Cysteiniphilum]|uniref:Shikimate kinase n=1 Tax=Cysteiniphilum litorale TaxID=2056700 RepID=A0A8J3E9X7_9GAMM|nr:MULTISPECIES: shikimate kinase AroK [Cysteiniphilum]WHN65346.1 shikimate kinase AroK [Cysteiniphilum sp. QT6929]GGG02774.1 shikimate kinase [Cysteiniphilum litorale]
MIITQNVFLIGPVGAGKSTIGRQLASELKLDFVDSDREIEQRCGVDIDWIFDIEGEEGFRKREQEVLGDLATRQGIVLATGGGAIILPENRTLLSSRGKVVYLQASIEQQLERTAKDKKRPLLQVDDKEAQLKKLMAEREPLYQEIADITIETSETTVRNVVQKITNLLMEEAV